MRVEIPLNSTSAARPAPRNLRLSAIVAAALFLVSCGPAPIAQGINDPYEQDNRRVHQLNLAIDRSLVSPGAKGYGAIVPDPLKQGVSNVADTLGLPNSIVNNVLQGRLGKAGQNTLRLAINLTLGVGGLVDAATIYGVPEADTDFGETLHVWGVGEGKYVVLPVVGPSTERDALGVVVDAVLDPVGLMLPRDEARAVLGVRAAGGLGKRDRFSDTIDSILYGSADGYAQQRLLYLQNRRFELGQAGTAADADASSDAGFIDPYEDPYAE